MKKKGLLDLPAAERVKITPTDKQQSYKLSAQVFKVDDVDILRATIYSISTGNPIYYIFCDKTGECFITYNIRDSKWSNACIFNLLWEYNALDEIAYNNKQSKTIGAKYFEDETVRTTAYAIKEFQMKIRNYQLRQRHLNSRNHIDSIMDQAEELPREKIIRFIDNHILKYSRLGYYTRAGKQIEVYCGHCKKDFTAKAKKGLMINTEIRCPHCHSRLTLKSKKRPPFITDKGVMQYMQRCNDGFMLRFFKINKRHNDYILKPAEITYFETHRTYIDFSGRAEYFEYKPRYTRFGVQKTDWQKTPYDYSYYAILYSGNIKQVIKDTKYQYSALNLLAQHPRRIDIEEFFHLYDRCKGTEYLIKIGLHNIVYDLCSSKSGDYYNVICDCDANTPTRILGIEKVHIQFLREHKLDTKWVPILCRHRKITEREIKTIFNLAKKNFSNDYWRIESFYKKIAELPNTKSLDTQLRYLYKQYELGIDDHYCSLNDTLRDYIDYIADCHKLELNLKDKSVLFPQNLANAHANTTTQIQIKANAGLTKKIQAQFTALSKRYGYRGSDYIIFPAASAEELITEGQLMHHCVGRYCEKMANGRCTILFLRRAEEPDKPLATIEVDGNKVIQIRAKRNTVPDKDVMDFFEEYKKTVLTKTRKVG